MWDFTIEEKAAREVADNLIVLLMNLDYEMNDAVAHLRSKGVDDEVIRQFELLHHRVTVGLDAYQAEVTKLKLRKK